MDASGRFQSGFTVGDVSVDQRATCKRLLEREKTGRLLLMPTHHVNQEGDLSGFCYRCSGSAKGSSLPISRKLFFGLGYARWTARRGRLSFLRWLGSTMPTSVGTPVKCAHTRHIWSARVDWIRHVMNSATCWWTWGTNGLQVSLNTCICWFIYSKF